MRRRFALVVWVAVLAAFLIPASPRAAGGGDPSTRGVSHLVFHLTSYDEASGILQRGQGILVGSRGAAIVSVSTLDGAIRAVATMMDGSTLSVREVRAVDEVSGLAKVRLYRDTPRPSKKLTGRRTPQVGERIIFSDLTARGDQVCVECSITLSRMIPGLAGLHYVETSQPIPQPGGAVFGSDGSLVGMVAMRFGNGCSGILVSNERLSTLASQRGRNTALGRWTNRRSEKWIDMPYARYVRGQVAFWQGQPDTTLSLLEDHVGLVPHLKSNIEALLGETYLAMELLPEAVLAFRAAIDSGSAPGWAYRKLAWAYMETGQYVQAEAMCYEATRIDPGLASGYNLLAHLRNLQGEYQQAVYEAARGINRDPDCSCAHFERGRGYIGLTRFQDAIESLKKATTLDPMYGEAFSNLGYAYIRSGKPLHAVVVLKEAVKLEPEMSTAWESLGDAYSRANLSEKALGAWHNSVCVDPSRSHSYCRLAEEFLKQGQYFNAAEILRRGLDQCEGSQWLLYYLGKTYYLEGRIDLAGEQADLLYRENKELALQLLRIISAGSDS
jgi:tetratricopeptide (TPR) repeat protein